MKLPIVLLLILVGGQAARAGGIVVDRRGDLVPQAELELFIEQRLGQQTSYLGILTEPRRGHSVWIVPVPGAPADVRAETVDIYPYVPVARPAVEQARTRLQSMRLLALALDTGQLCVTIGARAQPGLKTPSGHLLQDTSVHHEAIPEGGSVVLLPARNVEALADFFAACLIPLQDEVTEALEPYLGGEFTLVCIFVDSGDTPVLARALKVNFPSPDVFVGLQALRGQEEPALAAIVIRDWWLAPAGLRGKPAYLRVVPREGRSDLDDLPRDAPITRVLFQGPPAEWGEDLRWTKGTPASVQFASWLERQGPWLFMAVPGLLGILLAVWLPFLVIPTGHRLRIDFGWALAVGLAACLSIYASAVVFYLWCWLRHVGDDEPPARPERLALWLALIMLMAAVSFDFENRLTGAFDKISAVLLIVSSFVLPYAMLLAVNTVARGKTYLLIAFAACHLLLLYLGTMILDRWLSVFA